MQPLKLENLTAQFDSIVRRYRDGGLIAYRDAGELLKYEGGLPEVNRLKGMMRFALFGFVETDHFADVGKMFMSLKTGIFAKNWKNGRKCHKNSWKNGQN